VLGPEKLPRAASQVGRWVGRARAMARQFREQLEEEVNLENVKRAHKEEEARREAEAKQAASDGTAAAQSTAGTDAAGGQGAGSAQASAGTYQAREGHGPESVPKDQGAEGHGPESVPRDQGAEGHGPESVPRDQGAEGHGPETVPMGGGTDGHGQESVPKWQAAEGYGSVSVPASQAGEGHGAMAEPAPRSHDSIQAGSPYTQSAASPNALFGARTSQDPSTFHADTVSKAHSTGEFGASHLSASRSAADTAAGSHITAADTAVVGARPPPQASATSDLHRAEGDGAYASATSTAPEARAGAHPATTPDKSGPA
jgi:sec-independent protein translocase protein TatB